MSEWGEVGGALREVYVHVWVVLVRGGSLWLIVAHCEEVEGP